MAVHSSMLLKITLTLAIALAECQEGYFLHMGNCHRREPGAGMQAPDPVLCPEAVSGPGNCKPGKCFGIGGEELSYCSQCADATEVPLNGACDKPEETQACTRKQDGVCTQCAKKTFMYKGGCYSTVGVPGVKMCKEATDGVCTSPAPGYFVLPADDRDASHQSVVSCGDGEGASGRTKLYKGVEGCAECTLSVPATTATCNRCTTKNLSPLKDACLTDCPAGTYLDSTGDNGNTCRLCHESCASCSTNAETSCTACYPGYVLKRDETNAKGTCIKECTGDFMAHCKADGCSLNVGGSKYCDQCEDGYAPVDGVCTKVASTTRDASGCKASGGKCTECGANYALLSGGCYNTRKLPGSSVCTAAQNKGQCQTCANGQTYADGNCPACTEGCAKCASGKETCTDCLAGYYKGAGDKCFKCTDSDKASSNAITGVENCISCAPPTGGSGPVTCYVTQQEADDGTGGDTGGDSTNRSGLSTGAIAGISVAVIVVVGGLVGFLCWWFICRGKA
ncbi:Variant-specific surface protein [Giardia duodenalis]|uniref:Variant-specific surface protein n=1 Tax=Giardia intestinalis TaxID=5741 RepID=V6TJE3_GIAIN|nr:Variant-specific surface protein [Giardia intestinalis]